MINQLDKALRRLLKQTHADAAVLWAQRAHPTGAAVLGSAPADLIAAGTEWPVLSTPDLNTIERDPARLAAIVPTTLRLRLPRPPGAAQVFELGENLYLLAVWYDANPPDQNSDVLRHLIRNDLSYLARLLEDNRFNESESGRLLAVLNGLSEAVVSIDPHLGQADVNAAAAALLTLPAGRIPTSEFAAAMTRLAARAVNGDEAAAAAAHLHRDPAAEFEGMWRFTDAPTHLRVRSAAVRQGAFHGRIWTFTDESALSQALESSERSRELIEATADAALDPQVILELVRDGSGRVVDLRYLDANRATCDYLGVRKEDLLAGSALKDLPNLEGSGLLARYSQCAQTGEPVVLNDFDYFNEMLDDARRYDIRATRVRPDVLNLTWRDITDRFLAARRIAESEERFRLLAENSADVVTRVRDGVFLWVSPSIEAAFGAPPEYWIGRPVQTLVPPGGEAAQAVRLNTLAAGEPVFTRVELVGLDGQRHWVHLHAKPIRDDDGQLDGFTAALRIIDDEVAAEHLAQEALSRQIATDALYRRSIESAAVGMCLADLEGNFVQVNPALCRFFGYDAATLKQKTWQQITAPDYLQADLDKREDVLAGRTDSYQLLKKFIHADGHPIWGDLAVGCIRDADGQVETFIGQVTDVTAEVQARAQLDEARRLQAKADALYRESMNSAAVGMCLSDINSDFVDINPAMCEFFGYPAETLRGMSWQDLTAPESLEADLENWTAIKEGRIDSYQMVKKFIHADGHPLWGELSVGCVRDTDGQVEVFVAQINDITDEVEVNRQLEEARQAQADADARYRRLMANSNVGMTLITPDGQFDVVNRALCDFFGYDEATLRTKTWQELTAADYLEADLGKVDDVLAGRIDAYRMTKQYVHADGHLIWGDLSVSCLRDSDGQVERFVSQIADISAETEARNQILQRDKQNRVLTRRLQAQTDRMKSELDSAADYVASLLPGELTGPLRVTSSYLPSRELGGDCFGYSWVDDDHLIVYLIDVSGHGIAPALMSISVLNMLRSGSLPRGVLLDPARLLGELNTHFQMDRQGDNYFTIFYAVYHRPTRTVRYASAGHPPAVLFPPGGHPVRLSAEALPIGMFRETVFVAEDCAVPAGSRLLVYSDGAFELPLPGDRHWDLDSFIDLCAEQSAAADWNLDRLTTNLLSRTAGGQFEDDCSLILVQFD